jgi:hypothetical protein
MDATKLEGIRAKLQRAETQLGELRSQLKIGWEQHLYGIDTRDDLESHETVVVLLKPRLLFVGYSVVICEVVHQMRSALEHIVWQMVPNPRQGVTGFPVFTLERKDLAHPGKRYYESHGLRMIDGIDPAAEALIRSLQPFATATDQRLRLLNEMWNWDKHRLLNTMVVAPRAFSPWYRYLDSGRQVFLPTLPIPEIADGAEIARYAHPADFMPGKVQMEAEVEIAIRFIDAGPADGQSPEELLAGLLQFTKGIVDRLVAI